MAVLYINGGKLSWAMVYALLAPDLATFLAPAPHAVALMPHSGMDVERTRMALNAATRGRRTLGGNAGWPAVTLLTPGAPPWSQWAPRDRGMVPFCAARWRLEPALALARTLGTSLALPVPACEAERQRESLQGVAFAYPLVDRDLDREDCAALAGNVEDRPRCRDCPLAATDDPPCPCL